MKFHFELLAITFGATLLVVCFPSRSLSLTTAEVGQIAKDITVRIDNQHSGSGSGVLIKREKDIYTVLTSKHVVQDEYDYILITPDSQTHPINSGTIQFVPNVDLAILQFSSTQNYPIVKIGDSAKISEGMTSYVSGFPIKTAAITEYIYTFTEGTISANATNALEDGYALVYSNRTLPGMSGGPVLDNEGQLIGIHGRADTQNQAAEETMNVGIRIKTGFNLGIPIRKFLSIAARTMPQLGFEMPSLLAVIQPAKADNFYLQGISKTQQGDLLGAVSDYDQALRLNPDYTDAYYNRGLVRYKSGNLQGAVSDFNQAIRLNSKFEDAFYNRGLARHELGDTQGAISDYDQAIKRSKKDAAAFYNRGLVRYQAGDPKGAVLDFGQAISLNPDFSQAYYNRGVISHDFGNPQGAISDFTQAIRLNPNDPDGYYNRGAVRHETKDYSGAIADYSQAIYLNPNYARAYLNRGVAHSYRGEIAEAKIDFQKSAELAQIQGNQVLYQQSLERLKK
jgi:tetratricopeptide (TPR) repeat protein